MRIISKRLAVVLLLLMMLPGCGVEHENSKQPSDTYETVVKNDVVPDGENAEEKRISDMRVMLEEYAVASFVAPIDASVNGKNWEVIPAKPGRKLNVDKTVEVLMNARENVVDDYVFDEVAPVVTTEILKKKIKVIGKYTTILLDRSDSRVNNIELASQKINNTILKPGEEFSFNRIVGKRTALKGYEEAPIIIRTPEGPKKKNAKGGGICQVSTTIYNAVGKCGMKVTERHMHSKKVAYVPKGKDATVSYGSVDFRFVNTRSNPIMLKLEIDSKYLRVRILENTTGSLQGYVNQ